MTTLTWDTATEWDNAVSEEGAVHESTTNTDHNDATIVKQGYPAATPLFSASLNNYYPLHEDSGTTAYDFAGTTNGSIVGATVGQTGILGTTAYSIDGTDDEVDLGSVQLVSGDFTIAVWVYRTSSKNNCILWHGSGGNGYSFSFRIASDNTASLAIPGGTNHGTTTTVSANTWHFVSFSFNSTDNTSLFRLDGATESSSGDAPASSSDNQTQIGMRASGNNVFDGKIANVKIYGAYLDASQTQRLYDVVNDGYLTTASKVS